MYNFKEVSSVNNKYIFFNNDTRQVLKVKYVPDLMHDIQKELSQFEFMYNKMNESYDILTLKIDGYKKMIESNNKLIDSNIDQPIVRRGLSEYHDNLNRYKRSLNDALLIRQGTFNAYDNDYVMKLEKILRSCMTIVNNFKCN